MPVLRALAIVAAALLGVAPATAQVKPATMGIVLMHGKGGMPGRHVAPLAAGLELQGHLVANLEMPWSGRRQYDASVEGAEQEVGAALQSLRTKGATRLFVAGHSQGALFALYYGGKHPVDGVIAIAPGGNVASPLFRKELGPSLDEARRLVAQGKGADKAELRDYEGSRGTYAIRAAPAAYVSWFDPDGPMNQMKALRAIPAERPVLFVAPKNDYVALQRLKATMFGALPPHPLTRLVEPDASHLEAPAASRDEIVRWMAEVGASAGASAARR